MGNIFGREAEIGPPPVEPEPAIRVQRQPFYYDEAYENALNLPEIPRIEPPRPCMFYARGTCTKGTACRFSHARATATPPTRPPQRPCRYFIRGHCKKAEACNFSHDQTSAQELPETTGDQDFTESWLRQLGGAWAKFGDGAAITDVSFPSDFSAIQIRNLPSTASANFVKTLLSDIGITVLTSDIRYIKPRDMPNGFAIVKVQDPAFAKTACARLHTCIDPPNLEVNSICVPIPLGIHFGQVDNRQVRCSWHRPNRTCYLYYTNKKIAAKSFLKFKNGGYKVNGTKVTTQSLVALDADQQDGRWKFQLIGLNANITEDDIVSIIPSADQPFRIVMGDLNYEIDMEMDSTLVKSMLYEIGELERWDIYDNPAARRIKAQAVFTEGSHAQAAISSLNGKELPFNSAGKLFVQLITSVKFKVSTRVYEAVKKRIDAQKPGWSLQFVRYSDLPERGFNRILKLEGEDSEKLAQAKRTLEHIIAGTVMTIDGKNIWHSHLKFGKNAYRKLQKIERDLKVVIIRDVRASNFRAFGPEDQFRQAAEALHQLIEEIESGDQNNKKKGSSIEEQRLETDCPLCFDEAEDKLRTSCGHTYCSGCFFNMCEAEATKPGDFSICCVGDSGTCTKVFEISQIQQLLLSETFENILEASFASFIRRHPADFRHCPTPDCDQVYRVSVSGKVPSLFTCARGNNSDDLERLIKVKEELEVRGM
ncbi:hypothetical protein FHETE_3916 [Fusarium heterosporum]|uniref:C3H1-type domain-containing protein n=1 Tax=Fusarium heterosporum TaxID=42747 RepID=A0A8H5TN18_FUSHE|nr:hypothetical protein FHETE_3916 [Fusarium heterosporum]